MKKKILSAAAGIILAAVLAPAAFAGTLKEDMEGWWYRMDDGSVLESAWQWIDENKDGIAECYYFGEDGYMEKGKEVAGYILNELGQWVQNGVVATKEVAVEETANVPDRQTAERLAWGFSGIIYEKYIQLTYGEDEAGIPDVNLTASQIPAEAKAQGFNAYQFLFDAGDARIRNLVDSNDYHLITDQSVREIMNSLYSSVSEEDIAAVYDLSLGTEDGARKYVAYGDFEAFVHYFFDNEDMKITEEDGRVCLSGEVVCDSEDASSESAKHYYVYLIPTSSESSFDGWQLDQIIVK
ncbi:MAG: hypothetical protein IJT43_02185 [Stomatobaculum sp.]|nr:hypothetical protein [Stomatobaculum sp.]